MTISSVRELNMRVKEEAIFLQDLLAEINKVMVGQEALVERVLIALWRMGTSCWKASLVLPKPC